MSESGSNKQETYGPWVAGAFAVAIIALGMYLNFGGATHHNAEASVSASSRTSK